MDGGREEEGEALLRLRSAEDRDPSRGPMGAWKVGRGAGGADKRCL